MNPFNSVRRDLLRVGSLGMASAALPALASAAGKDIKPLAASPATFNVRQFGATGDGKTLDTPAVNRAIEAAAAAGGGTVLFPAGIYLCFSIRLKSYVHLYLDSGATILAADSPKPGEATGYNGGVYDAAEPMTAWDAYQDYGHNHWHNSLLWAEDQHDFSVTGRGLIYGKGLSFGAGPGRGQQTGLRGFGSEPPAGAPAPNQTAAPAQPAAPPNPARMARGDYPMYQAEQAGVGNKAIALKNCRNVLLRDFSLLKGGHFALLLTGVDNLTIDNLTIDTDRDGMDIDCCQNVRVSNCTVNSPWDDGICPKSSYALGYARPTRNVTIANCFVTGCYQLGTVLDGTWKKFPAGQRAYGTGRIKCGTESNGGFINIAITGCVFEGCQGYALETVDGALLEDIAIVNTTMRDLISPPLFLRLGARLRGPKDSTKVGTLKRVLVSNLECHNAPMRVTSILSGIPGYNIEDVKLSNIYIENLGGATADAAAIKPPEKEDSYPEPGMFGQMPSLGFFLRHIRNVEMSHVELATLSPDARPAFYLQDVERADFFAITAPKTASGNFALNNVKDLRIGWSRAAADTMIESADQKMV
ncbi:MAG: glycoside hydrolase family 28 protein [Terracidiphilus sp.]|jgi:polygalacturonase